MPGASPPLVSRPAALPPIDWKGWARALERKRRSLRRLWSDSKPSDGHPPQPESPDAHDPPASPATLLLPRLYLARVSRASFQMDGIDVSEREVADALRNPTAFPQWQFRSGQSKRLRNHLSILRRVQRLVRQARPLSAATIVGWYASVGCGLSTAAVGAGVLARLDLIARQINSPHLNLRPAVEEIAALHLDLLRDPVVPGFNGILARLLLACHLGRCGLPPVLFRPETDQIVPDDAGAFLRHLLELISSSHDALVEAAQARTP